MITVKMKRDANGADDGATVRSYTTDGGPNGDGVYNVSDDLGNAFIEGDDAEEFSGKAAKAAKAAPETTGGIPGIPSLQVPGK